MTMTYKESLFFIGKCLTINHEKLNKTSVEADLKTNKIDWDAIVKVSTGHYVFPALYCNLKKANFLQYVPDDLVEYMQHISDLNRERNEQIIIQAKELNTVLLANNITPVFLKGTGNLLGELYDDIAERMVGDIDFLVSMDDFEKSIQILKEFEYSKFHKEKPDDTFISRHYPKMIKEDRIASIEIHYKMVTNPSFSVFDYNFIKNDILNNDNISQLSYQDQVIMTAINKQINDNSERYKHFGLRNSYDLFLLSQKTSPLEAIKKLKKTEALNNFLYSSFHLLGQPKSIHFLKTKKTTSFFKKQLRSYSSKQVIKTKTKVHFFYVMKLLFKAIYSKKHRNYVISKVISKL